MAAPPSCAPSPLRPATLATGFYRCSRRGTGRCCSSARKFRLPGFLLTDRTASLVAVPSPRRSRKHWSSGMCGCAFLQALKRGVVPAVPSALTSKRWHSKLCPCTAVSHVTPDVFRGHAGATSHGRSSLKQSAQAISVFGCVRAQSAHDVSTQCWGRTPVPCSERLQHVPLRHAHRSSLARPPCGRRSDVQGFPGAWT